MFGRLLALSLALLALGQVTTARAQVEVTLAEEKADKLVSDIDRIDTRSIQGKFRGIRVYVLDGGAVDITKIDVNYSDGTTFTEDRGRLIRLDRKDVRTRIMGPDDGRGPEKFIDQIVMYYKTAPGEVRKARVRVTGITSSSGARAKRPANAVPVVVKPPEPPPTVAGGAVMFGVQNVGFGVDRDIIKVGREYGRFDKVKLRVLDNDIFLIETRVVYGNGDPDVIAVNETIKANTRTKWFTLKGDRFIKEIQLIYKSRPGFKGQARVEVFGEYAEGWYGPNPSGSGISTAGEAFKHGANRGWLYLGGQQAMFFSLSLKRGIGYETDIISVARNWGFHRIRLDVKDRAIQLNKLAVVYADGSKDEHKVGLKVDGGSSYGPVPLQPKPIKEVQVSYRSRVFDKRATSKAHAFVEFWAQ